MFAAAADFGLSTLMVRDLSTGRGDGAYLGTALRLKASLNAVLALTMVAVEPLIDPGGQARWLIYVMGLQMFVASLSLVLFALFRSRERMAVESMITGGISALSLISAAALIQAKGSLLQLVASYASCSALGLGAATLLARSYLPRRLPWRPEVARMLLRETWPLGAGMMATSVYYFYDRVLMGALGQQAEIGWYTAAYAPALWLTGVITQVRTAFLPAQSRALAGKQEAAPVLKTYAGVSLALGLPVAIAGLFLSRPMLAAVYGNEFTPATFAMQVLLVTVAVMFVSSFLGSNLLAAGLQRRYLRAVIIGAAANVALNSFMVPLWSLDGAAVATLLSEAAVAAWMWRESTSSVPLPSLRRIAIRPAFACLALTAMLLLALPLVHFVVAAILAGLAYAAVLWALSSKRGRPPAARRLKAA